MLNKIGLRAYYVFTILIIATGGIPKGRLKSMRASIGKTELTLPRRIR
jgi:hypothetical protein